MNGTSIDIPDGTSRQAAYRIALRALDDHYTSRPVPDVHEPSEEEHSDINNDTEPGERADTSVSTPDSGAGRETTDSGESDPPAELGGESVDGRTADGPDSTPVEAGSTDVEPVTSERTEPESRESTSESRDSQFYYASHEATTGTN